MKKIIALVFLSMILSTALPLQTKAQTIAELQAQINNLLSILTKLQSDLVVLRNNEASLQNFVFTNNLTVGSQGGDVIQLQKFLVSRGLLVMPAGVIYGYFGPLTQEALSTFQMSEKITPAVGFFGPITRTRINNILAQNNPPFLNPPNVGITTPGIEGIMSITNSNAGLRSSVYEGDSQAPILGMRISARLSDIVIQRVKLNLGNSSRIYNRILEKVYVTDGVNVLASADLNSSNVFREGNNYFITITGFNYVIPKNSDRNLIIKTDVRPNIDSTDQTTPINIAIANNGVRGIDGAGIDHFAPSSGATISRNLSIQRSLVETATLHISLNSNTPRTQEIVADEGLNNDEYDRLALLIFNLRAEKDDVKITDLKINIAKSGIGEAKASSTIYLYEGSGEIDNAPIINGIANLQNLDYIIPQNTTRTLTVRTDIRDANVNPANFVVNILANDITAENSIGDLLNSNNIRGSATSYSIAVRNVGSEIVLVSKTINSNGVPQNSNSTSIATAAWNVRIKAVGNDLILGTPASTTPAFNNDSFVVYRNGTPYSVSDSFKALSFSIPSGANTAGLTNSFRIAEGSEIILPVTFQLRGRNDTDTLNPGIYAIGLEKITWIAGSTLQEVSFMAGDPDWRTIDISFP